MGWEEFIRWLRNAPWSIWFGRFLAIVYPLILAIKFTYALTVAGVFPLPVVFLLVSIATVFNMACFWLVVPYLCKKLFSESLTDETITLNIEEKEETYKVMRNGKNVKVTWPARILIYAVSLGVMITAIGTAGIGIAAFIPTLSGLGLHGLAHLSTASTISLFAPLAVIIIISYTALAVKDVSELLSRENLKETMKKNIRTALGLDAAIKCNPDDLEAQQRYKHRKWAILALSTIFVALGILGTFTTASIGLNIIAKTFSLTALEPFLVAYAVVSMTPFLVKTLYQFSDAIFRGYDALVKTYQTELNKNNATPVTAALNTMKIVFIKALTSIAFYVGLAGTVNATCQGFIASLHYPNLSERPAAEQTVAGLRIGGNAGKYEGLAVKTAEGWENRGIAATKVISIEETTQYLFDENKLINDDQPEEIISSAKKASVRNVSFISYDKNGKICKKDAMPTLKDAQYAITDDGHIKKQYAKLKQP